MKKLIALSIALAATILSLSTLLAQASHESDGRLAIGISKLMAHPALDSIEQGIKDHLADCGIEAVFETQNANGEISTASSIAQLFRTEGKDIVVGIATPTAQALANTFSDRPVVFATVTDPEAAGLSGLGNVCGTSDMVPIEEHLRLIEEVNAVYVSTDNTVISAIPALSDVAKEAGVPLFSADTTSSFGTDVMVAGGFDYYRSGRQTGEIVSRILSGESPASIGTVLLTDLELYINTEAADELGITIPEDMLAEAAYVI